MSDVAPVAKDLSVTAVLRCKLNKRKTSRFSSLVLGISASLGRDSYYVSWLNLLVFCPLLVFMQCH